MTKLMLLASATAALVVAAMPSVAAADQPVMFPADNQPFAIPSACAFPVQLSIVTDNETVKIFSDGRTLVTGALKIELTNLVSQKSLVFNNSGPGQITVSDTGTVTITARGISIGIANVGDLYPGSPGFLIQTAGPVVTQVVPPLPPQITSAHVVDLCQALAAP